MKTEIVNFHNHSLITLKKDGEYYVAMKPIVEAIGLDWKSQYRRIASDEVLSTCMVIMTIVAADGKTREMLCLPISMLNGWLFGIHSGRVKPEIRPRLKEYKQESYKALDQFWRKKEGGENHLIEIMRQLTIREERSKTKGRIGSSLMHQRKREKHQLDAEWEALEAQTQLSLTSNN